MFGLAAARRDLAPSALLVVALAALFALGGDRSYFYRPENHTWDSAKNLTLAENLSPSRGFSLFIGDRVRADGSVEPVLYGRFPIGGPALVKLATMPFADSLSAKIAAARTLALAFFAAAMFMAFRALSRVFGDRWTALAAALLAFSAYHALYFSDHVSNETNMDLFGIMLVFHGIIVFSQDGKFAQLLAKTCVALLLGWHAYALIIPFAALGFAVEAIGRLRPALRNERAGGFRARAVASARILAARALRSRHVALALAAIAFGCAVLGFNLANEYAAYGGDRQFAELPTVKSALERTPLGDARPFDGYGGIFDWDDVLGRQLVRLGGASMPYALTGWGRDFGLFAFPETHRYAPAAVAFGGLAALAVVAAIAFAPRHKIALASLALAGFGWAVVMRLSASFPEHYHEAVFYAGASLVAFSVALAYARKRWGGAPAAVAVFAILIFAASVFQIGKIHRDPGQAEFHKAMMADFDRLRQIARGAPVAIDRSLLMRTMGGGAAPFRLHWVFYYLAGNPTTYADAGDERVRPTDFIVSMHKDGVGGVASLTPDNSLAFLYSGVSGEELHEARYAYLASQSPAARSDFDVYLRDNTLSYLKDGCAAADMARPFFINVFPADAGDLSPAREFDDFVFGFSEGGKSFGNKCMINAPLPPYPIESARTGQLISGEGVVWEVKIFAPTYLPEARRKALASEPVVRSEFDLYLDMDDRTLTYLKDPCGENDTRGRFFFAVFPANPDDMPDAPGWMHSDSLNFAFDDFGAILDGACVIVRNLPDYEIASIETGQYIPGERQLWNSAISVETGE